jgi:pimeloyl-[acyl-carrier protein] methyl ester esterase
MTPRPPTQVIAMHGWAGDSRSWEPFAAAAEPLGWQWITPNRGYGSQPPRAAAWDPGCGASGQCPRRVVIAHSLGPHLLPAAVLAEADAVVLLASFGRFVPEGREGRRLETALAGMAQALAGEDATPLLRQFLAEAAAPQTLDQLPSTILDGPLPEQGRERLLADLDLLASRRGLPAALPAAVPCLIVEAGADRIVVPEAQALLRQERPGAQVLTYPEAGHCLLGTPLARDVIAWIDAI